MCINIVGYMLQQQDKAMLLMQKMGAANFRIMYQFCGNYGR